jgi:hypothetical protein
MGHIVGQCGRHTTEGDLSPYQLHSHTHPATEERLFPISNSRDTHPTTTTDRIEATCRSLSVILGDQMQILWYVRIHPFLLGFVREYSLAALLFSPFPWTPWTPLFCTWNICTYLKRWRGLSIHMLTSTLWSFYDHFIGKGWYSALALNNEGLST